MELIKSEYCHFQKGRNDDLVVVFSSATVPRGKFSFSNVLSKCESNILYLNCPDNSWYLNSPVKDIPARKFYIDNINYVKKSINVKYVTFLGGSMGAYGSLLYGAILNADEIHCFGLEHKLFNALSNSCRYFRVKSETIIPDLVGIVSESQFKKLNIYYGERCIIDLYQASLMPSINKINLVPLKKITHSIPPHLINKINLASSIDKKSLYQDVLNNFEIGDSNIEFNGIFPELLHDAFVENTLNRVSEMTLNKLNAARISSNSKSFMHLFLAYEVLLQEKYSFNIKPCVLEKLQKTYVKEVYPALIRIIRKRSIDESLKLSSSAINLHDPKLLDSQLDIVYEHCVNLFQTKNYQELVNPSLDFIKFRPNHKHIRFILASAYLKLGLKNEALSIAPDKETLKSIKRYEILYNNLYGELSAC